MKRLALIGANGQVGTEVCLHLLTLPDIEPVAICRNRLASAFLRRCGVQCRIGDIRNPTDAGHLFADCHLVADFSFPRAPYVAARQMTAQIVESAMRHSPREAAFLYMSSLMAFGMPAGDPVVRSHIVARTQYGALKRHGERRSQHCAARLGKPVFILRLGQVHGGLQEVSRTFQHELRVLDGAPVYLPSAGVVSSNTVFCFTIAEAIAHIAKGSEAPGRYTLVSRPQWTWREIFEFYSRHSGVALAIRSAGPDQDNSKPRRWVRAIAVRAARLAASHREDIAASLLAWRPRWEMRLTAAYFRRKVRGDIEQMWGADGWRPFVLVGDAPGKQLRSITDTRTMDPSILLTVPAKLLP